MPSYQAAQGGLPGTAFVEPLESWAKWADCADATLTAIATARQTANTTEVPKTVPTRSGEQGIAQVFLRAKPPGAAGVGDHPLRSHDEVADAVRDIIQTGWLFVARPALSLVARRESVFDAPPLALETCWQARDICTGLALQLTDILTKRPLQPVACSFCGEELQSERAPRRGSRHCCKKPECKRSFTAERVREHRRRKRQSA